jgi:GT2 family glycosyltransferase
LLAAVCLRSLGRFSDRLAADVYTGWEARSERAVDWQSGCCVLFDGALLKRLNGFDEQFFYHFEETDLCYRVWQSGAPILFCPDAEITHLGGQSVGRFPTRFILETYRSKYRFFEKHYGRRALAQIRWVSLLHVWLRRTGYGLLRRVRPSKTLDDRLAMYRVLARWNWQLDPVRFIEAGEEPDSGYAPLAPAPKRWQAQVS